MGLSIKRLFRRRPAFSRSAARYACQLEGQIVVIERMLSFDGRIIDLSSGGAMFRPRLAYLMDRRDEPVCLTVGHMEITGRIMSTSPSGFGLRFDEPIGEEDIALLLRDDATARLVETPSAQGAQGGRLATA